ncbi:MAG: serine hydrolase domain-containing protein [Candidatus Oleimicrobiaceae bacterium]
MLVGGCTTIHRDASGPLPSTLREYAQDVCQRHRLPAFAMGTIEGQVREVAAVGVRKKGDPTPVDDADRFHIGSCTKLFTATLAALLVQKGHISWTTTAEGAFPELAETMDGSCRKITLEQLLLHRSGLLPLRDPTEERTLWRILTARKGTAVEQRLALVRYVLSRPPKHVPGTRRDYSNVGYAVAGAMLERRMGKPWEDPIKEHISVPLGITTLGFGPPGAAGTGLHPQQPWGTSPSWALRSQLSLDQTAIILQGWDRQDSCISPSRISRLRR